MHSDEWAQHTYNFDVLNKLSVFLHNYKKIGEISTGISSKYEIFPEDYRSFDIKDHLVNK